MKILVIASALALSFGGAAAPAFAEPTRAPGNAAPAASAMTASAAQAETRRYCVVQKQTDSLIQRKDCRTRADWLKEGFDPLDPK